MALDTQSKRQAAAGVGRPWMRTTFPVATPTEEWRISAGNAYGGNALSPGVGPAVAVFGHQQFHTTLN